MYLKRIEVAGYRASASAPIVCELSGRFSLILGANGSGKTTINEAIALAHPHRFPRLPPIDASALGATPRSVTIRYEFEADESREGALGEYRKRHGLAAPRWSRPLERSLGQVRAGRTIEPAEEYDSIRLVHLPALRNPVEDLSRRDARILLELLRADERRHPETDGLRSLRAKADGMLGSLTNHSLVRNVESRIAENLRIISGGIQEHHAFIGTQTVDDTYLARVFEMLVALIPDRATARRLQVSSLGYVNLLHIAVTLAGIPDAGSPLPPDDPPSDGGNTYEDVESDDERAEAARQRLALTAEAADADADSFYPDLFHATVLIEEPEAHLHPQLQYGLIRYLRSLVEERPDIQIIVTTHSADLASACDPDELVVVRKDVDNRTVSRRLADIPLVDDLKTRLFQQTRLHLDATRSAALFADRVLIVEGVTEANILRLLGRAWADSNARRTGFIDSLAILPVGHKIGEWPIRLLATPNHEFVTRVAALADTDLRGTPLPYPKPPAWHAELDAETARFFWSRPTLEPSLVSGNEALIKATFKKCGLDGPDRVDTMTVDQFFTNQAKHKGEFALAFAQLIDQNLNAVVIPDHISDMFTWLYDGTKPTSSPRTI
ncbi:putative ATP-dependent endonuclease of the OLD family [Actinomyces denticolens]|uniref:ATP-dependent endonuclease of the OLD family n=1 Tax=Actinomyces denticolens TaxID=52767 RepID=A0ABY1HYZ8_9ACTO|nr:putative ATP-dependent endonuclease of the OLD family [Actinomyces denticolens]